MSPGRRLAFAVMLASGVGLAASGAALRSAIERAAPVPVLVGLLWALLCGAGFVIGARGSE